MNNLLDRLEAGVRTSYEDGVASVVVPRGPGGADAEVIFSHGAPSEAARRAVAAMDCVASLSAYGARWRVEFAEEELARIGGELEEGMPGVLDLRSILDGTQWVVNFADPNTTKALHIGHLRNLALGHSLASSAEAAGAFVVRQSRVGDIGRNMGEAMAGYLSFGERQTPSAAAVKGDVFVGDLYSRYVRSALGGEQRAGSQDSTNAPLTREQGQRADLAEETLAKWRAGDPETLRLFRTLRQWVLEGQDRTLGRLGIEMDRTLHESDFLADAGELLEQALAKGIAMRAPDGAIVYDTGYEEYPYLLLAKSDGFPTQHLRYIATWEATSSLYGGARTLSVVGSEWGPLTKHCDEILRRLHPQAPVYPTDSVVHEMVTLGAGIVKSSEGEVPLVDDLLDQLADSQALKDLCDSHERGDIGEIVTAVALGSFLGRPKARRFSFSFEDLLGAHNVGLAIVRAWLSAWDAKHDGPAEVALWDENYRYALLASQLCRRMLAPALERLDLLAVARFYFHVAQWYLAQEPTPRLARVMRTVMDAGVMTLGLLPASRPQAVS